MNRGFQLEPKNGDYVAYVDRILSGNAGELTSMPAPVVETPSNGGMVRVRSSKEIAEQEQQRREMLNARRAKAARVLGPIITVFGFCLFALGGVTEREAVVILGAFLFGGGGVVAAVLNKRR